MACREMIEEGQDRCRAIYSTSWRERFASLKGTIHPNVQNSSGYTVFERKLSRGSWFPVPPIRKGTNGIASSVTRPLCFCSLAYYLFHFSYHPTSRLLRLQPIIFVHPSRERVVWSTTLLLPVLSIHAWCIIIIETTQQQRTLDELSYCSKP